MRNIVIGIPSLNEESTISSVVSAIDLGLSKMSNVKAVIINADNDSKDRTKEAFLGTKTLSPKKYINSGKSRIGKGHNMLNVLRIAAKMDADCIFFDADLRSIRSDWVLKYIKALESGFDFVSPSYMRSKNAATVTNQLMYPIFKGILGADIRQPIGGDIALSKSLVKFILQQLETNPPSFDITGFGIDAYISCSALAHKGKICNVNLGKKVHKPKDPSKELTAILIEETIPLFDFIISNNLDKLREFEQDIPYLWQNEIYSIGNHPVNLRKIKVVLKSTFLNLGVDLAKIINKDVLLRVSTQFLQTPDPILEIDDWAKIIEDLIIYFKKMKDAGTTDNNEYKKMMRCIFPFYLARVYSFAKEVKSLSESQSETIIKRNALRFYAKRKDLFRRLKNANPRTCQLYN